MSAAVDAPTLSLDVDDLVDWLELTALFSQYGTARTDSLVNSLRDQRESAEENIAEDDSERERIVERLENEIILRQRYLKDTYPFELGSSGEELLILENWKEEKYTFYLVCLITAHVTGSPILRRPPVTGLLTQLRNSIFQIISTLGVAGLARGPALSVGWPRRSGETIIQLLARGAALGGGFIVRDPPGALVSDAEKDGGVDVIAWRGGDGPPPPTSVYWGQTASGQNWLGKPVIDHARLFRNNYLLDHATGNHAHVTIIPFRVLDERVFRSQSLFHNALLDRLRLPLRAWEGFELFSSGTHVDEADRIGEIVIWLSEFIEYAQAA